MFDEFCTGEAEGCELGAQAGGSGDEFVVHTGRIVAGLGWCVNLC